MIKKTVSGLIEKIHNSSPDKKFSYFFLALMIWCFIIVIAQSFSARSGNYYMYGKILDYSLLVFMFAAIEYIPFRVREVKKKQEDAELERMKEKLISLRDEIKKIKG